MVSMRWLTGLSRKFVWNLASSQNSIKVHNCFECRTVTNVQDLGIGWITHNMPGQEVWPHIERNGESAAVENMFQLKVCEGASILILSDRIFFLSSTEICDEFWKSL